MTGAGLTATAVPAPRRSDPYGTTRTAVCARHALLAPDGIVPSVLPGWRGTACYVMISPAMGSRFCQYHLDVAADGGGEGNTGDRQWLVYVLEGNISVALVGQETRLLATGGYAYLPPGAAYQIQTAGAAARVLVFEKRYEALAGVAVPGAVFGQESEVAGAPFLGDPAAMLQILLPDVPAFDMAVNIFKYAPGATLPFVETHLMEHGLLMLAGEGIYRLEDRWYPVRAGDAIWMAPYCPQWFVATGKAPASYIYYKDVNRWPGL